jgi:predicted flavoprotein YhiN
MKYTKRRTTDIAVVGGAAAGMISAITAAEQGAGVTLVERSDRLGLKLRITGKGRCNLLNNCDIDTVLKNIPRNGRFLYSALQSFGPQNTMRFFESLSVPLKTERGNRVFPFRTKHPMLLNALISRMNELALIR